MNFYLFPDSFFKVENAFIRVSTSLRILNISCSGVCTIVINIKLYESIIDI